MESSAPDPARTRARIAMRGLTVALLLGVALGGSGCAAMFRGTSQTVTVVTDPPGGTVYYRGARVDDGERIAIRHQFRTPEFGLDGSRIPLTTSMSYDPDVWLVGDVGWFLLGGIPGVIAFGVDFGSGAWRRLDDRQLVRIPATTAAARPPEEKPTETIELGEPAEDRAITATRGIEP